MTAGAVVLTAVRSPVGRHGGRGTLSGIRVDDLAAHPVKASVFAACIGSGQGVATLFEAVPA
jgi:acetyl-CoA acetyltransferase